MRRAVRFAVQSDRTFAPLRICPNTRCSAVGAAAGRLLDGTWLLSILLCGALVDDAPEDGCCVGALTAAVEEELTCPGASWAPCTE